MEALELKIQKVEATPPSADDRPALVEITCNCCLGKARIFGRAIDSERSYATACLAVRAWITEHKHCSLQKFLPGLFSYL